MKLQPSRRKSCVHHATMLHATSCKDIRKVYACLAVTCHLHFLQNDRDLLRATAVTRGGTDTEIRVSTESRPCRRHFSRRSCRDSNPRPFNHESGALTTELSSPRNSSVASNNAASDTDCSTIQQQTLTPIQYSKRH